MPYQFLTKWKYEALLLSLLLLMFGNLVIPQEFEETVQAFFIVLNIVIGLSIFTFRKMWRWTIIIILSIIILLELLYLFSINDFRPLFAILYIVYFLILSVKLYHKIYSSKTAERELIVASFCGFVMLGLLVSFVFVIVEFNQPGSFSNIGTGSEKYQNLQYFSFITTLTIGYGDIAPVTNEAKQLTALFGLIGNFYSVFVMGIVIGKYLSNK